MITNVVLVHIQLRRKTGKKEIRDVSCEGREHGAVRTVWVQNGLGGWDWCLVVMMVAKVAFTTASSTLYSWGEGRDEHVDDCGGASRSLAGPGTAFVMSFGELR